MEKNSIENTPVGGEMIAFAKNVSFLEETISRLRSRISPALPNTPIAIATGRDRAVNPSVGNSLLYNELSSNNSKMNSLVNELCEIIDAVEL